MIKIKLFGMLTGAVLLAGVLFALLGFAPVSAQDDPAVIGDLALVKYVCPTNVSGTGTSIPAVCANANDPNGSDVPVIPVNGDVSFIYQVSYSCNPGVICEPLRPISVTITDNQLPGTTPTEFGPEVDANSNGLIDPGDVWLYKVNGLQAIDLSQPGLVLPGGGPVQGCTNAADGGGTRPTYVNLARVTGPSASQEDPAAYCNRPAAPTATLSSVCVNNVRTWTVSASQTGAYVAEFLISGSVVASINLNLTANTPQTFTYTGDPTTLSGVRVTFNGAAVATENGPYQSCATPTPTATLSSICVNNVRTWTVSASQTGAYVAQFLIGANVVASINLNLTANTPQTFTYTGDPTTLSSVSITFGGAVIATNNGPYVACASPTPTRPVEIPEPITVVLFGTGLAALSAALAARKRSAK